MSSKKSVIMSKKSKSKNVKKIKSANVVEDKSDLSKVNDLTTSEIFRLVDLHFDKKNYIFRHLYDSYNKFIEEDVKNYLEFGDNVFTETMTATTYYRHRFKFTNIRVQEPVLENGVEPMFPSDARHGNLTYSIKMLSTVTQYQDIIDIATDEKKVNQVGNIEDDVPISVIPLMLRSKWCSLSTNKSTDKNECSYDAGGYFIVNGNEKVIISQDRMVENKPLVFVKKDSGAMSLIVQVNAKSYKPNGITQVIAIKIKKDKIMLIRVPILNEINVFILMRALGLESDRDIINYTVYDENDIDMVDLARVTLDNCKNESGTKIQTQQEAVDYLITKLRVLRKYTETDEETKLEQKKLHLMKLLQHSLLPHVEGNLIKKAHYLGYMIHKLLRVSLKRDEIDYRDSYINKRIDLPGDLLFELYRQQFKKMLGECKKFFDNRNKDNTKPLNVINYIKPNTIEQGLKASLSTGHWIRRQGVAQMLQRLTYLQTISFLRRVDAPSGESSGVKLIAPRHLHPSSIGSLCCVTGDTKITMADYTIKQIKDVKNGDCVISIDKKTCNEVITPIKNWFSKSTDKLLKITTSEEQILKCTPDHKFLVTTMVQNFMKEAEKLNNNDFVIISKNFKTFVVQIKSVETIEPELVYDFETCLDTHTFVANNFVISNCVQTPEHAKVGLTKHLSMIGSITIMSRDQYFLLKDYLVDKVIDTADVPVIELRNNSVYKVFLNGDWLGVTYDYIKLEEEMIKMKLYGDFDQKNVSIVSNHEQCELKIYCDSGRLYRPTIRVVDNEIQLKKSHINEISLNKTNKLNKITTWEEFLIKNPKVIEYIDSELQPYIMISDKIKEVEDNRIKMTESIDKVKNIKSRHVDNRYDDMFFVRYTHCEIHPSLLVGEITTNVPFCDHNPGARNIFQYAQSRQAMGIYATNYRDRLDISFILYNPQKPIVSTRGCRYTNSDILPAGENTIVAISTYTGYNQEDSLIFNRTSIELGKFRAMYFKKYILQVQKNHTTAQEDVLMKPDPIKVSGMKHTAYAYNKLNDKGYVPEETIIHNGDVIMGKVTPTPDPTGTGKQFKDSSEIYKMHASGVVDRVYTGIQNQDGYEIRKMLVRSERVPRIGDKYCCYDDQTEVLTDKGWLYFKDLTKEHKVASLQNGDTLVYQNPSALQEYDFDGDMYSVKSNQVDLVVTPNHRMFVKPHGAKKHRIEKAEDIFNKIVQYKKNAEVFEPDQSTCEFISGDSFVLPSFKDREAKKIDLDAWLEFFGIWIAEGCAGGNSVKFAANKPRVKESLRKVCEIMHFKLCENVDKKSDAEKNCFRVNNVQLENYMEQFSVGAINKFLPEWVWLLKPDQCKTLLNGMILGDGHQMKGCSTRRYDTSSNRLADDFQRLCLHAGYATNISVKYDAGHVATIKNGKRAGERIKSTVDALRMSVIETQVNPKVNKDRKTNIADSWVKYKGKVYCCTVSSKENKEKDKNDLEGVIYVRRNKVPVWSGNSRHGQKGTIGILLQGVDMPFTAEGITPDIILNPNAIPSRRTVGQFLETVTGKVAAINGEDADGTIFEDYDLESLQARLKAAGYKENGKEWLYNGMTGERMKHMIFIGPTYYQRLKHLVEDKIHSRSRGPRTLLTRQPPEGRSRDGGLRLGEMERDSLLAHGLSKFILEKLLHNSDSYATFVCDKCGLFAQRFRRKENKSYSSPDDIYYCPTCNNYNEISKIVIPYAFKLLIQELLSMCIAPRIRTKKSNND